MSKLRVFTFSPAFGLPTCGPFALKLVRWLDLAGIPYEQVVEDDASKGPNKKNPWVELDGERIPDTEIIIGRLGQLYRFDLDADIHTADRARLHTVRRMIEEHLHMVFEWEMFVHPNGFPFVVSLAEAVAPKPLARPAAAYFCAKMKRQLSARGLARHSNETIAQKGIADVDALETMLGNQSFLVGERISLADVSAYGMMQPMAKWPMSTPVANHIKSRPRICDWLARIEAMPAQRRLAA